MRDSKISALGRNSLLALGSLAVVGCGEPPTEVFEPPTGIQSGIWLLARSERPQVNVADPCRPMLMRVKVSSSEVTLERRLFPCNTQTYSFDHISFARDGSVLRIGNQIMGSISERRLEVDLPFAKGTISWDMDREYETYRETSSKGRFVAYPELRPDSTPVATHVLLEGKETVPLFGHLHAARLPETMIEYGIEDTLAHCKLESIDPVSGFFRVVPDPNFTGSDGFSFWPILNGTKLPGETVEIQIGGKPLLPYGPEMSVNAPEDFPTYIAPEIVNPESLDYKLEIVDPPTHGKVASDGVPPTSWSFIYMPDPDYNGPDSFTYATVVAEGVSTKSKVQINVVPVNDRPIAGDLNIQVMSNDATSIQLPVTDIDSSSFDILVIDEPLHGTVFGNTTNLVYVPNPDFLEGDDYFTYSVSDFESSSSPGIVKISVVPGDYPSQLLVGNVTSEVTPVWSDPFATSVYYEASIFGTAPSVGVTGFGLTAQFLQGKEADTFGFDSPHVNPTSATFFGLDSHLYFTTSTNTNGFRIYETIGLSSGKLNDIPAPSTNIIAGPAVGTAYVETDSAFLPIHWQTVDSNYTCQIWKITTSSLQPALIQTFPPAKTPCFGLKSLGTAQYMFVGSSLVQFATMASPPVFIKDLGNAEPLPWLVEAAGKLFFQTRTVIQGDIQIDLWVTDGTSAGTQVVKQIEKGPATFDIHSSLPFLGKLYFSHKKSLWSSDGTAAGTNIVKTIDVTNVIGDGAIGAISAINGRLYFLATSDLTGREPWISDGTAAGTSLLGDLRPGAVGSSVPSTHPAYFHDWNGKIYFLANGGTDSFGLWTTDGTPSGTKLLRKRDMTTIVGFHTNKLVYHHGPNIFAMTLQ